MKDGYGQRKRKRIPTWIENYNKGDLARPRPTLWQEGYK